MRFPRFFAANLTALLLILPAWAARAADMADETTGTPETGSAEAQFVANVRQLTFEGRRAGEGYFSKDGTKLVFQSERMPDNPFYQIFLMDLESGDVNRISPGYGKTTCSWIHPTENKVLFASTHKDTRSKELQKEELEFRASGKERRYSWDYDEHYDIFVADFNGKILQQLTDAQGYDAEGSYSPDGKLVVFSSNRRAYSEHMSEEDAKIFDMDKSYMMDIYIMNADGSNVRQLTTAKGYDGGPFFSPDGKRIVWRRFAPNGATAEVYTMNIDGSDKRQLTDIGAMSWAPYYHPSGDYIIFTNNSLGFANFELFIVDTQGRHEPVRVTYTDGFDGLPVFSPDGTKLAWTSNRTPSGQSQLFIADWNDSEARRLLQLDETPPEEVTLENEPDFGSTAPAIRAADIRQHIEYLASDYMQGRLTGTIGERRATAYAADVFKGIGLRPAGVDGTYFQQFEFTAGVSLGDDNRLHLKSPANGESFTPDKDWRPLAFSATGEIPPSEIVFAGYGIQAPGDDDNEEYDSFVHLDVKDKWVMAFRYMPENVSPEIRQHLATHSSLRYKAMTVRDLGARGLIVVSGPKAQVKDELVPMYFDASLGGSGTSVAAISITNAAAQHILDLANKDLGELQEQLDDGSTAMGFSIPEATLSANIDIEQQKRIGRNVLARLDASDKPGDTAILIGAHIDHLGIGRSGMSLAHDDEADQIHHGADDNASGVAGLLEIAQYLKQQKENGLDFKHDVIFAAWSGEELGSLGSNYFVNHFDHKKEGDSLRPEIAAYLNMDMIGRLNDKLIVQGVASSSLWPREIERRNVPIGLSIVPQKDTYIPTDATTLYMRGVPFINAFTGAHEDYHRPTDTADKINYSGAEEIARFMGLVARALVSQDGEPDYQEVAPPKQAGTLGHVYLGTIPDYAAEVKGVKLAGVTKGAPADEAGLQQGDIVVELAGRKIENIYDYTFAIEALKIGDEVTIVVERNGKRVDLKITPGSRE